MIKWRDRPFVYTFLNVLCSLAWEGQSSPTSHDQTTPGQNHTPPTAAAVRQSNILIRWVGCVPVYCLN